MVGLMKTNSFYNRRFCFFNSCRLSLFWLVAVLMLICSGAVYRVLAARFEFIVGKGAKLPVSLSDFPFRVGNWSGEDLPIHTTTRDYMEKNFADDFFSRRYINKEAKNWADVYVVYCSSRIAGILGHRPRICYTGAGWVHDGTDESYVVTASGRKVSCLIHRFHMPGSQYRETVVLSFYIVGGRISVREGDFSDLFGRLPNIGGDPARYIAQVQVSSSVESSVRSAARDIIDTVLVFFPNTVNIEPEDVTASVGIDAN